jgi:hypothetical protein
MAARLSVVAKTWVQTFSLHLLQNEAIPLTPNVGAARSAVLTASAQAYPQAVGTTPAPAGWSRTDQAEVEGFNPSMPVTHRSGSGNARTRVADAFGA